MLRIRLHFKSFTPSNTNMEKTNEYPEMGSVFKASFLKAALWFFTKVAIELSGKWPKETRIAHGL